MLLFSHFLRLLTRPSFLLTSHPYFRGLSLIMSLLFSLLSIFQFSISRYLISMHVSVNLYFSLSFTLTLSFLPLTYSHSHSLFLSLTLSLSLPPSHSLSLLLSYCISLTGSIRCEYTARKSRGCHQEKLETVCWIFGFGGQRGQRSGVNFDSLLLNRLFHLSIFIFCCLYQEIFFFEISRQFRWT